MSASVTGALVETAFAKINLALHVRARRADGFHELETVFAFAEDGDRLEAAADDALTLEVVGPFASELGGESDNLVLRAAHSLRERAATRAGARLRLDKRLPVASGIGGGSADAAAALRLLAKLWHLGNDDALLLEIASELGSDVPACVASRAVRGSGRGERLDPVHDRIAGTPLLLVNPRVPLATGAVFRGWDGIDHGPLADGPVLAVAARGRNDLEPPAIALVPAIAEILDWLSGQPGVTLARMSGSGATCFALFADEPARDAATAAIAGRNPGWWLLPSRLR